LGKRFDLAIVCAAYLMNSSTSHVPYIAKRKGVMFLSHDKAEPFHRMIFNVRYTDRSDA